MDEQAVIQYMDDPALALDKAWTVQAANAAFEALLGERRGVSVETLLAPNPELATAHETQLAHYPDVGGVIEEGQGHFDPNHRTVAALRDHRDPGDDDPDVGVFVNGTLRYFHVATVDIADNGVHLLVFRDITPVKDHEQDLNFLRQVMGRVLRHNLRNDLSVIRTYASLIAEESDDERAEWAQTIMDKSDTLVETTRKTRLIEEAVENNDPVDHDLVRAVDGAVERVREDDPEADIVTDVPDIGVEALPPFEQALIDTVENAVIYGEGGAVEVMATAQDGMVTITVDDQGPGIPAGELETFERRGETDLSHGSGAGLWLLYTVVHESGGEVAFDTDGGTTVRITLPVADTSV